MGALSACNVPADGNVTAVLAVQGAFAEHERMLDALGQPWFERRDADDLELPFARLILPGGESTTQGKLLRERGMKAVISIIGRYTDLFSERDENNAYYSHCTWNQLREMQQSGLIEIQNHTYNLHTYYRSRHGCASLKWETMDDYRRTVGADIQKLQQRIRDELGFTPNTMVYPFGSFTERSEQLVRELGFSASLSCESGVTHVTGPESLFGMKRFLRPAGTDSASFFASIGLNR